MRIKVLGCSGSEDLHAEMVALSRQADAHPLAADVAVRGDRGERRRLAIHDALQGYIHAARERDGIEGRGGRVQVLPANEELRRNETIQKKVGLNLDVVFENAGHPSLRGILTAAAHDQAMIGTEAGIGRYLKRCCRAAPLRPTGWKCLRRSCLKGLNRNGGARKLPGLQFLNPQSNRRCGTGLHWQSPNK